MLSSVVEMVYLKLLLLYSFATLTAALCHDIERAGWKLIGWVKGKGRGLDQSISTVTFLINLWSADQWTTLELHLKQDISCSSAVLIMSWQCIIMRTSKLCGYRMRKNCENIGWDTRTLCLMTTACNYLVLDYLIKITSLIYGT